jgi:hypothetical protein
MPDPITLSVSVLALSVSAATAWLTLFRRGTVLMTQPTVIYFGPDAPPPHKPPPPKIYLRTLLFATSKRGRVIEAMHASLSRNESHQNFNIWVHGEEKLVRGSGLFVGDTGVAANHHFLTPKDGAEFKFLPGTYRLKVFAKLLGDARQKILFSQELTVTSEFAQSLTERGVGLYFDWGPDSGQYIAHVDKRAPNPDLASYLEVLASTTPMENLPREAR